MTAKATGVSVLIVLAVTSGVCVAGQNKENDGVDAKKARGAARFAQMDTDENGTLSLEEFTVAHNKRIETRKEKMGDKWNEERAAKMPSAAEIFKKIDADDDGALTQDEMRAAHQKRMGAHRGEHRRKRDGSGEGCSSKKKPEAEDDAEGDDGLEEGV